MSWLARLALVVGLLFGLQGPASAAPSGFTFCANEYDSCEVPSGAYFTFGYGEGACDVTTLACSAGYIPLQEIPAGPTPCDRGPYGDPYPGAGKACYYILKSSAPPATPASAASGVSVGNVTLVLPDFLNLSAADGLALSVAILSVWATAWATRQIVRALGSSDGDKD